MKIGFVVDGVTEFASLPCIYTRLSNATGNQFLRPLKVDIQPKAPVGVIVRQSIRGVRQYAARDADRIILLLDREDRDECPGELAREIEAGLKGLGYTNASVVLKDRTFENWLIADIGAVRRCRGRFVVSNAMIGAVEPDKADRADALRLLKRAVKHGDSYDKVKDGKALLDGALLENIALNSRSFRRLLRTIGAAAYVDQSLRPRAS
jgi:hypothetical protein